MKGIDALQSPIPQAEFAELIGVSEARVSQLVAERVIVRGDTAAEWLLAYCERLRDMAAGRASATGGLDLVQERAALAREQREGQAIKNAIARGDYAPITLLAEVLATASQAISERFEQLPGQLRKVCPDLPDAARDQVMSAIADARNQWVGQTQKLVAVRVASTDDDLEDESEEGVG